jgi:PqqD family protein of HPr-rel-A system
MVSSAMWRASHGSRLHWREWDGEFVVYDDVSGDTHRLNALSAKTLEIVAVSGVSLGPLTEQLALELALPLDDNLRSQVTEVLARLSDTGLIDILPNDHRSGASQAGPR